MAAFKQQEPPQVDPDNVLLWQGAGLNLLREGPTISLAQMDEHILDDGGEDETCHALMWILAKIAKFLKDESIPDSGDQRPGAWKDLRKLLDVWHEGLPILFRPYASMPLESDMGSIIGTPESRFDQLCFTVPMCGLALQLYHFAQILLLARYPIQSNVQDASRLRIFGQISQESRYHGRQICNIALGIRHCLALHHQMIEPLYLAGTCLAEAEDRSVVIDLLKDVQKGSGNQAAKRVQDLISIWGSEDGTNALLAS